MGEKKGSITENGISVQTNVDGEKVELNNVITYLMEKC